MKLSTCLIVVCFITSQVLAFKGFGKKKYSSKDKDKLAEWVSAKKKPQYHDKAENKWPFVKSSKLTAKKDDKEVQTGPLTLQRQSKKRLDRWKKNWRMEDGYLKEKTGAYNPKQIKHNHLYGKLRAREDREYMPPCYGFNYLTAIDALMAADGGPPVPDPMELRDMLSDVQDMKLADKLSDMVEKCVQQKKDAPTCPKMSKKPLLKLPSECVEHCAADADCPGFGELCCDTSCGGRVCVDPAAKKAIAAKYRSADGIGGGRSAAAKCQVADAYMQCLYDGIKEQVCPYNY